MVPGTILLPYTHIGGRAGTPASGCQAERAHADGGVEDAGVI